MAEFNHKKILITGGSGYIAQNLLQRLIQIPCKISIISRNVENIVTRNGLAEVLFIDESIDNITDWSPLISDVDVIFHLAAQTSIYRAQSDPIQDLQINVLPMLRLLEDCKKSGNKLSIIFSSTVTIAGIPDRVPVDESYHDNPITIYDIHKSMAEQYLKHYIMSGYVNGSILRFSNVYGPGPSSSSKDRGILNLMINRALQGESLTLFGDGSCIRDYIYIQDIVDALIKVYEEIDITNGKYFVIGSGIGFTISEAFQLIQNKVLMKNGKSGEIIHVDPPDELHQIETRNFIANSTLFSTITGWQAKVTLDQGILLTIEQYLKNPE